MRRARRSRFRREPADPDRLPPGLRQDDGGRNKHEPRKRRIGHQWVRVLRADRSGISRRDCPSIGRPSRQNSIIRSSSVLTPQLPELAHEQRRIDAESVPDAGTIDRTLIMARTAKIARPERSVVRRKVLDTRHVTAIALAIGAVLGIGGSIAGAGVTQNVLYAVSSLGLITGAALLAQRHYGAGSPTVAAGFALLALAEAQTLAGGAPQLPSAQAAFAGALALYLPALLLISLPPGIHIVGRIAGALAVIPFGAFSWLYFTGAKPDPAGPLPGAGYGLLTIAILVWIWMLYRSAARKACRSWPLAPASVRVTGKLFEIEALAAANRRSAWQFSEVWAAI
jgi:hypothetical protein